MLGEAPFRTFSPPRLALWPAVADAEGYYLLELSVRRVLLAVGISSLILSAAQPALAEFQDGNQLLRVCSSNAVQDEAYCAGFMSAAADAHRAAPHYANSICLSPDVALGQVRDVVLQYLQNEPQLRHYVAVSIVFEALADAFPC